jgi:hypothetical protein
MAHNVSLSDSYRNDSYRKDLRIAAKKHGAFRSVFLSAFAMVAKEDETFGNH